MFAKPIKKAVAKVFAAALFSGKSNADYSNSSYEV
jgi:hypothetical protein